MLTFNISAAERLLVERIATRAVALATQLGEDVSKIDVMMDITVTHANGQALRLDDLAAAPDFDFLHDVFGIRRHLDRDTGRLGGYFTPRFAQRRAAA